MILCGGRMEEDVWGDRTYDSSSGGWDGLNKCK